MSDFSNIIAEINTNLPDNNTQQITAKKLRDTLIDLTDVIDENMDDFEDNINQDFSDLSTNLTDDISHYKNDIDAIVDCVVTDVDGIKKYVDVKEVDQVKRGYIEASNNGRWHSYTGTQQYFAAFYRVTPGETLMLYTYNPDIAGNYYAFYTSSITTAIGDTTFRYDQKNGINQNVVVPAGAYYLAIQYMFSSLGNDENIAVYGQDTFLKFNNLLQFVPTNKTNLDLLCDQILPVTLREGQVLRANNTFATSSYNSISTGLVACEPGDRFIYFGYGSSPSTNYPNAVLTEPDEIPTTGTVAVSWIFFDLDRNVVSSWRMAAARSYYKITIPEGVHGIRFSSLIIPTSVSAASNPMFLRHKSSMGAVLAEITSSKKNPDRIKWDDVHWTVIGDSLTESNLRATSNYHTYINSWTKIRVNNMGLSGSGYKEKYDTNQAFYQRVQDIPLDTDVITIFGSGNDMHRMTGTSTLKYEIGEPTDTGTTTICGCVNTTFDYIQEHFPLVPFGVVTTTPHKNYNDVPSNPDSPMNEYVDKIIAICKRRSIPCLDLYHCSNLHPESQKFDEVAYKRDGTYYAATSSTEGAYQVTAEILDIVKAFGLPNAQVGDWVTFRCSGVHPDEEGHRLIAPRFKAFLESLINKY